MAGQRTSKPLLAVLSGTKPERRPVWLMRQAGRYLPEYRAVRQQAGSFLDLCYDSAQAAEVTLQPLRRYDLDAAIVFSDILVLLDAMGVGVGFETGEGPKLEVVADAERVGRLGRVAGTWQLTRLGETLQRVKERLGSHVTLIGFSGAPWTLASYAIEGGGSPAREKARRAVYEGAPWFGALMDRLQVEIVDYLSAQIAAGAEVVQIFDSWAGDLPASLHERLVIEPLAAIRRALGERHPSVPVILFARGIGAGHERLAERTGANAVGIEQGVPIAWAARTLAPRCAVQGNLDPLLLALGGAGLDKAVDEIVAAIPAERHVFNLGHGVRPETDPEQVARVVARVRAS